MEWIRHFEKILKSKLESAYNIPSLRLFLLEREYVLDKGKEKLYLFRTIFGIRFHFLSLLQISYPKIKINHRSK